MDVKVFLDKIKEQFEETDEKNIELNTEFKALESWDSLTATAIQVMIEDDYGVDITDEDLDNVQLVEDLFDMVSKRKKNG